MLETVLPRLTERFAKPCRHMGRDGTCLFRRKTAVKRGRFESLLTDERVAILSLDTFKDPEPKKGDLFEVDGTAYRIKGVFTSTYVLEISLYAV